MIEDLRLHPPDAKEKFIEGLIRDGLFESKQAAMMFAAALGCRRSDAQKVGKAGEGIRWQIFERNQDTTFIYALAIDSEKTINVLDGDGSETVRRVFEEYASGGFDYLQQHLSGDADALDSLLLLIAEARQDNKGPQVGLEGLSSGVIDVLGL